MKSNYHCAVKDCKREFCALHRFPKFNEQPERFRLFVEATGNDNLKKLTPRKIYDRIRICNNHFKLEDMRRVGDNRFALFRHAVPSVNIYESKTPAFWVYQFLEGSNVLEDVSGK